MRETRRFGVGVAIKISGERKMDGKVIPSDVLLEVVIDRHSKCDRSWVGKPCDLTVIAKTLG